MENVTHWTAGLFFGYVAAKTEGNPPQLAALLSLALVVNLALRAFWWYRGQR